MYIAAIDSAQKLTDNLARLAAMHEQGHLSDAQYERAKEVLLERVTGSPPHQSERPVWHVDRMLWRCIQHRTPRCATCSEVVPPPTSPGREGDVHPGGDWQPQPDPDWKAYVPPLPPQPIFRRRKSKKR